jgi:4-diphosphocytidyl-2-C-methyl-D-erythritol kinase
MKLEERAPAKINLTLKVLGRRADGYHEIESLVAFAGFGDMLSLTLDAELSLETCGPFAASLGGDDNLILQAAYRVKERCPDIQVGAFVLEKNLPVAAGLGGGSADAGAALRLLGKANPGLIPVQIMEETACELGSDVLACLMSHATVMSGRGEKLSPLKTFPAVDTVLFNPGIPLRAGDVYAAMEAAKLGDEPLAGHVCQASFVSSSELLKHMSDTGNDLQRPAIRLAPMIGDVLAALSGQEGCEAAQMSGSGSTCFGIFANAGQAAGARERLRKSHPDWWVISTRIE